MKQPRYNIFNSIHKALRAMLYETAIRVQQTAFNNHEEAGITINGLEKLLRYFDEHAAHEDRFILPAIAEFEPKLVADFEAEHVTDIALAASLNAYILKWREVAREATGNATDDARHDARHDAILLQTGRDILVDFSEFIAFNLVHMNKEEKVLNEVLWKHYSDPEIHGIEHALVSSIPPETMLDENKWIMRNLNSLEVTAFLTGLKCNAPEPVFKLHMAMAEDELPEQRWGRVKTAMTEGLMIHS